MVSIIIPVYNAEKYLNACISSIVNQTYKDLEVWIVNDGSHDFSFQIADAWKKKDSRIHIINQENSGVTNARKLGLSYSKGEWVCFVDADDELPPTSIAELVENHESYDIVIGQPSVNKGKWPFKPMEKTLTGKTYLSYLLRKKIHGGLWARIFKRSLFGDISIFDLPREIICGEDFLSNIRIAQRANNVLLIKNIVYRYFIRPNSAMSQNPWLNCNYLKNFENILDSSMQNTPNFKIAILINKAHRRWVCFKALIKQFIKSKLLR